MMRPVNVRRSLWVMALCLLTVQLLSPQQGLNHDSEEVTEIRVGYMSNLFSGVAQKDAEAALEVWARKFVEDHSWSYPLAREGCGRVFMRGPCTGRSSTGGLC